MFKKCIVLTLVVLALGTCELGESFQPPSYTIVYISNGGTGQMENSHHVYGTAQNLNAIGFTRTGFSFAGWANTPSGSVVFTDTQSVSNLTQETGAIIRLYAQWNINTFTVIYNANGGSGSMEDHVFYYDEEQNLKPNTFINPYNKFIGWAKSVSGLVEFEDQKSVKNLTEEPDGIVNLYAMWEILMPAVAPVLTAGNAQIFVSWDAMPEAEFYDIFFGVDVNPPQTAGLTVNASATSASITGLVNGTNYNVWIRGRNTFGVGMISSPSIAKPIGNMSVVIISASDQKLSLSWGAVAGADEYEVYFSTTSTMPASPAQIITATTATIDDLVNGTTYFIWVRGKNFSGTSNTSTIVNGRPLGTPVAPSINPGVGQITISWAAVTGADEYEVYYGTSPTPTVFATTTTGTTTTITGLTNETTYFVRFRARNANGVSDFSPTASGMPSVFAAAPQAPAAPVVIIGNGQIGVSWQAVSGATAYEVWLATANNAILASQHGEDISVSLSTTISGLSNGTTYFIWLRAKNSSGTSGFSPYASGTPSIFTVMPIAPQTAPSVSAGNGQLSLNWQAVVGAMMYEIWLGTTNNSGLASKYGDDVYGLSAVISGLANGTNYFVWIRAKNNVGTSGFSPAGSGMPSILAVPPDAPAAPAVVIGSEQISINWQAVTGATAYEVWLATVNNSASALQHGADISESLFTTISGLNNGTTYFIWLRAKNSTGTSGFSPSANGRPIADAIAPVLTTGNTQIAVNWTTIAGADQYELFVGTGVNPPQIASQTINAPSTSATITSLVNGTSYNVWIRGSNSSGTGSMSSAAAAIPIGNMGVVSLNAGNNQLSLSWAPVAGADEYEVYYSTTNSIPSNPSQIVFEPAATISGLVNGTTYFVWVRGRNANGVSNTSTVVSGRPLGTPGAPTLTSGLNQLTVTWAAVAGADEYEVYYGIGTATTLATTTAGTTATITGLIAGTTYHVRLRAKNTNGISNFGPTASGMPSETLTPGLWRGSELIGNQNLASALTWISANAVTGDEFIIVLGADETISPATLGYSGRTVGIILQGFGSERTVTLGSNGSMFTVNAGVSLTLDENITLVGRSANNASLVRVNQDATLVMNDGARVTGNTASLGGGISIGSNATFSMYGGEIINNTSTSGGGIHSSNGNLIIHGGNIDGNTANSGGGIVQNGGNFIMYGGKIRGNTATNSVGGGVIVMNIGTFTMHGGIVSGNIANSDGGGVYVNSGSGAIFRKTPINGEQNSGIIYGAEAVGYDDKGLPLRNTGLGSAVNDYAWTNPRLRNTTAWET
ncbi:MAG: fibronectin type III domain-containing protein, partial [Treponema sp.]|nr:fibronectin type III domain-containing protein [Treponema sp.]